MKTNENKFQKGSALFIQVGILIVIILVSFFISFAANISKVKNQDMPSNEQIGIEDWMLNPEYLEESITIEPWMMNPDYLKQNL